MGSRRSSVYNGGDSARSCSLKRKVHTLYRRRFQKDVFFHSADWEGTITKDGVTQKLLPEVELWVEFELDDEHRETNDRLRAKVVRPTTRPTGRKLSGRDATFRIVTHHPNARRKRPNWRK